MIKNHYKFSPTRQDAPTGATILYFGMPGSISDLITHAKCYVKQFSGFGVRTPPNLSYSIGLADCS